LDTNVFVIAFETRCEYSLEIEDFFSTLRARPGRAVTSELTLAELLAPVTLPLALPQNMRKKLYLDLLLHSGLIDLRPVSRDILIDTADLRNEAAQKLPDAIHVATAIHAGCNLFLSNDKGVRLPASPIRRARVDRAGISEALEALTK
jgi:predicted nucleic acid-binding protein